MPIQLKGVLIAAMCLLAFPVFAKNHAVFMRNAASSDAQDINVLEPALLNVETGDTVTFVPIDNGHNSASKRGMLPEGGKAGTVRWITVHGHFHRAWRVRLYLRASL